MKRRITVILSIFTVFTIIGCNNTRQSSTPASGTICGTIILPSSQANVQTATASSFYAARTFAKVTLRHSPAAPQSTSNERIIQLSSEISETKAVQIIALYGGKLKKKLYGSAATYLITVNDKTFSNSAAAKNPAIRKVSSNRIAHAFATPNDTYFAAPYFWNHAMLSMPGAWDIQKGYASTVVAVIDTGVAPNHPDLAGNLVAGYDFVDNDVEPWDITYYDANNQYSHGTHVAGIISAVTNNNVGVAGIGWNVKIMPIRVLDAAGNGNFLNIASGINWAVEHGANIINLSLGVSGLSPNDFDAAIIVSAIDNAIQRGVTIVAASGNYGTSAPAVCFPANYGPVIAVAALDQNGTMTSYSCYGPELDICAPGGNVPASQSQTEWAAKTILSTSFDKQSNQNCYAFMSGTSMAAPHITGVAALLYSKGIHGPANIESRIKAAATPLGSAIYGAGGANAYAALSGNTCTATVFYYNLANPSNSSSYYTTHPNGTYKFSNLQPGNYKVCVFIDTDQSGNVSSGDLATISGPIAVTSGNTQFVNLSLATISNIAPDSISHYFQKSL